MSLQLQQHSVRPGDAAGRAERSCGRLGRHRTSCELTWADNATDEQGFELERRRVGEQDWVLVADLPADSQAYGDSNLLQGTGYDYRVRAYNGAGDSAYAGPVRATTTAPAPPDAPTGLSAVAITGNRVDLTWSDVSGNESGYRVRRDSGGGFVQIADLPANSKSFTDNGVESGKTYDYQVAAYNGQGEGVATASVTVDPPALPSDLVASGEIPREGTVAGSYRDTWQPAGAERITEQLLGTVKVVSRMEHIWRFDNVPGSGAVMLHADVSGPTADGERFNFYYSPNEGRGPYTYLFAAKSGSDNSLQSVELPSDAAGTIYIRVRDSSRSRRSTSLDTLEVRQLYLEASDDVPLTAPSNLSATALSDSEIQLTWTDGNGEDHYEVERRDGASWVTVDADVAAGREAFTVSGLQADSDYTFRVCAVSAASESACSGQATATTLDGDDDGGGSIELNSFGFIRQGLQFAFLTWDGALGNRVVIYRDGVPVGPSTMNDGNYRDSIGASGTASYSYQVCEMDSGACSNPSLVVF